MRKECVSDIKQHRLWDQHSSVDGETKNRWVIAILFGSAELS